ncbi:MAG: HptB-dependent secretion and biofilm anti anti-sigma factor [Thiomicrorhabdus sp.]|nr:MAG: HptB-dependent secretion and biofilm anti anti-sigma factor [Thiomicrorhabdus sp.]
MSISASVKGELVTVFIDGSFDVSAYEAFKDICQENLTATNRFIIDMAGASYMDSSALGMLLLLREKTAGDKKRITLINVSKNVQSILEIAQFQKLFVIQ